jgi:hypothetical protein
MPALVETGTSAFVPLDAIIGIDSIRRSIPDLAKENWKHPGNTRHTEDTVTDNCYLIDAKEPCAGCTLVNLGRPEKGLIYNPNLPVGDVDRMRINVPFVVEVAQSLVDQRNINLLTYMGGEPLTIHDFDRVVDWTVKHPTLNGLIYSSSAYFLAPHGGLNRKAQKYEAAGLFSPEFGYFKSSVDMLIADPRQITPKGHEYHGDTFKSYSGLRLTEKLADMGYDVAIHQTLKTYTIDHTLKLYEWAKERGIKFSLCPMVWLPYAKDGKPKSNHSSRLTSAHEGQLQEIVDYMISDTISRFRNGQKRILNNSSAFMRLMPKYGPENGISCRVHRRQKQPKNFAPNGRDIYPSGEERWCIAQNTPEKGLNCGGCFYIGIDRSSDFWAFEYLAGLKPDDIRFANGDVWKKDPDFDPTGTNLFFDVNGNALQQITN